MSSRSIHHRNGTTKGSNVQTVSHVVISFRFQHFTCHVYGDRWLSLCNVIVTAINRYGHKTHCTRPAEAWRPSLERTLLWVSEIGLRPKWIWQGSKGQGCEMNGTEEVERFITRGVWFWGLYKKMRDWESFSNKKPLFLQEPLGKNASLAAVSMGRYAQLLHQTGMVCVYLRASWLCVCNRSYMQTWISNVTRCFKDPKVTIAKRTQYPNKSIVVINFMLTESDDNNWNIDYTKMVDMLAYLWY